MTCGARRVHHHANIVVGESNGRRCGDVDCKSALVGAVGALVIDLEQVWQPTTPCEFLSGSGEVLVVDQQPGSRITQNVLEFRHGKPPVERQHDGADPATSELELEVFS